MSFNKLYEKINSMVMLEVFNYGDQVKNLQKEFPGEFLVIDNLNIKSFNEFSKENQYEILRVLDVFYRNGKPLMTDAQYDGYYNIYHKHDGDATTPIMFEPSIAGWEKCEHDIPMGSLDKASSIDEIEKWNRKPGIIGKPILLSEKLDGISLEVIYENGKFKRAITRGDGKQGDDITENAQYFDGMVKQLQEPWDCAIRGEVVITKSNLHTINTILIADGKDPLKNTRNGVSGQATKYKDRNEEILSLITFIAYEIQVFKIHETGENVV